jgi:hypothetical protein
MMTIVVTHVMEIDIDKESVIIIIIIDIVITPEVEVVGKTITEFIFLFSM